PLTPHSIISLSTSYHVYFISDNFFHLQNEIKFIEDFPQYSYRLFLTLQEFSICPFLLLAPCRAFRHPRRRRQLLLVQSFFRHASLFLSNRLSLPILKELFHHCQPPAK